MTERPSPPDECANCGAAIPRHARACPACGADERTGWRESSIYDGLDLPDAAYEDEASRPDRTARPSPRINGVRWYWWVAAVVLALLFLVVSVGLR